MHIYAVGKLRGSVKSDQDNSSDFHTITPCTNYPPTGAHRRPQAHTGAHRCPQAPTDAHRRPQVHTGAHRRIRGINPSDQALYWLIQTYFTFTPSLGRHRSTYFAQEEVRDAHLILKGTQSAQRSANLFLLKTSDCSTPLMSH